MTKPCVYRPDRTTGPDYRGAYPCALCGLPKHNARHQAPIPDHPSDRAAGKTDDE